MTTPNESLSYRTRWSSQTHSSTPVDNIKDWEVQIVSEHLGSGWVQEKGSDTEFVFSTRLEDGKKWTRHYDRRTCRFICQRFYAIENSIKSVGWPNGTFGE